MPIIFSGSKMQGGGGVSQMDPYANTFLSGFGQGLNIGAVSVARGADMAEQRRQDAQRQGEWDRQYGLQQQAFDYRQQQDAMERTRSDAARKAAWSANAPLLAAVTPDQPAPGGVGPPVPGAVPDLSAMDPQQQAQILNQYQQQQLFRVQQQKMQAVQTGLQEMGPATMQLIAGMPDTSPLKQVYGRQLAMIGQMAQVDPEGALDAFQKIGQAAAMEVGKAQARQQALPGVEQYASQFPLTPAERNAVVALVASGAIEPEHVGDQIKKIMEAKKAPGTLTPQDLQGLFPGLTPDRAAVLAKAEASGRHLDLPEVSITGQQRPGSLSNDPVLKLLEMKMQNARAAASNTFDNSGAKTALTELERQYEDRLNELGGAAGAGGRSTPPQGEPTDAQIDEALRALGPGASDEKVLDWIRSHGGGSK